MSKENKELEQEIHSEAMKLRTSPCYEELEAFARHFVELGENWQKQHDAKLREDNNICCMKFDDIEKAREGAYEEGKKMIREEMMKRAVDAEVSIDYYDDQGRENVVVFASNVIAEEHGIKDGDKVKVIIVKEE